MGLRGMGWGLVALGLGLASAPWLAGCGGGETGPAGDLVSHGDLQIPGKDVPDIPNVITMDLGPGDPGAVPDGGAGADVAIPDGASGDGMTPGDPGDVEDPGDPGEEADAADPGEDVPPVTEPGLAAKGYLYAHGSDRLYRWVPGWANPQVIATFQWPAGASSREMTDLAIDYDGRMYGVSFDAFYRVNAETGACTKLADFSEQFNGLTLVPKGTVDPNSEALIAIANDGGWNQVTIQGTKAVLTELGHYSKGYTSDGDAYSIAGLGTFAAVDGGVGSAFLVKVDPKTGATTDIGPIKNAQNVYGLAGIGGQAYAFAEDGTIYRVDVTTGATQVAWPVPPATTDIRWWGAAVSTRGQ